MEQKFLKFHEDNPHVYEELKKLALDVKRRGFNHYGIGALYEVMRFHRIMSTTDTEYKLSNNHRAFYSRLLMANEPELAGFFTTKRQRSLDA